MARKNEFVNYLLELPQPFGNVGASAMFGGHGVYKDGLIFGIVVDDTFYLVRPAGRTHLEVKVLYTPGKGKC